MVIMPLLDSSWLWHFLRTTLSLMTLTVWRSTGQIFCRMSLSWNMSDVFPMIRVDLWVFMWMTPEVKCHSHHVTSRVSISNMTSLLMLTLGGSCQVFVLCLFSLSILNALEGSHHQPPLRSEYLCSIYMTTEHLQKFFGFFCKGDLFILTIYLFVYFLLSNLFI